MSIQITDTFGPALARASKELPARLKQATHRNAYVAQRAVVKGIRTNSLAVVAGWPALSSEYARRKRESGGSSKMLIGPDRKSTPRSPDHSGGELMRSYEVNTQTFSFELGTNNPYARAHEFGYAPRGLPARPHLKPAVKEAMPEMLENWGDALRGLI